MGMKRKSEKSETNMFEFYRGVTCAYTNMQEALMKQAVEHWTSGDDEIADVLRGVAHDCHQKAQQAIRDQIAWKEKP